MKGDSQLGFFLSILLVEYFCKPSSTHEMSPSLAEALDKKQMVPLLPSLQIGQMWAMANALPSTSPRWLARSMGLEPTVEAVDPCT